MRGPSSSGPLACSSHPLSLSPPSSWSLLRTTDPDPNALLRLDRPPALTPAAGSLCLAGRGLSAAGDRGSWEFWPQGQALSVRWCGQQSLRMRLHQEFGWILATAVGLGTDPAEGPLPSRAPLSLCGITWQFCAHLLDPLHDSRALQTTRASDLAVLAGGPTGSRKY